MQVKTLRHLGMAAVLALVLFGIVLAIIHSHASRHLGPPTAQLTRQNGVVVVSDDSPLMKRLVVMPVRSTTVPHGLRVPGIVQNDPRLSVNILTPVTGRVISTTLQPGQVVQKGDVLAVISSGDFDQAYADMVKAHAQETYQERVVGRARAVLNVGGNAQKDLDAALNDLTQARAERQRAERRLEALDSQIDKDGEGLVRLLAPRDGLIASTSLAPGVNITDVTAVQAVLLDISHVQIDAEVPEEAVGMVTVGQSMSALVTALPGRRCVGPIQSIDPVLHADTRRMVAHILCDNADHALHPNMFVDAEIEVRQPEMVMVPKTALLMNNDRLSVFVQGGEPMHFRRQSVTVSYDEGEFVRVLSGIKSGDQIVTRGAILLNDND